jgi:two-component system, chemotaxis family, sensor kinase CheA
MPDQMEQDASLLQDFLTECEELLEHLDQNLVTLESAPDDSELLNQIFRAFHTIKGTSGFMGFQHVVALTHQAEDLLNLMRKRERKVTRRAMDVLLNVLDQLRHMFADIRQGTTREYSLGELLGRLKQLMEPETPSGQEPPGDRPMLGEILVAEGAISHAERREALQEAIESGQKLGHVLIEKQLATPGQVREALNKQAAAGEVKETARTIRVDVMKLDELVNLTGELVLERNRITQLTRDYASRRFSEEQFEGALGQSSSRLSFITEELQAASLKTRMVPIDVVFRKFPRMVRDLSNTLGKEVNLVVRGEDTELDRTIIEEISDPLVHLIRNSLDHGIESPAIREANKKPRKGTLRLEARPEGDFILVLVTDDGGGINPERVAAKAVARGIVTRERADTMERREILDLIFLPGFSTAEKTSDVSGRGVGMDVVRTNMKKLNGTVGLDSELGRGTTITLKLPLTLAILPVLLVRVGEDTYALPLRSVMEILRVDESQVHASEGGEILHVRDQIIPLGRVARLLRQDQKKKATDGRLRVVVLQLGEQKMGLVVDDFLGQEETVIKPLGAQLGHIPGVAGGTISGEGNIRLILDPAGLVEILAGKGA